FFITVNGGDARSRGIELSADAWIGDRLRASAAYAFNRAELASFVVGLVDGVADGFKGDRLPGTPEHQGALRLDYAAPLSRHWNVGLGYSLATTSDIYTKVGRRNGGEALPGHAIHNVAVTFRARDNWSIRVFVDNLLDKFAETNTRTDPGFIRNVGVHPLRSYFRNVAAPRRYGFEVRYDFGEDRSP
ncbi:MAG: TonB-dependent receptor, partial [Woeseia sp.]